MGLKIDGTRSILGYYLPGGEERATNWMEVFTDLRGRGLKTVKITISDDLKGLERAIEEVYPVARHQLCWFHLKKNIKNRVRKSHWNEILKELNDIMEQDNQEEAERMMKEFINKWVRIYRSFYTLKSKIRNYLHFFLIFRKDKKLF
jgi:putative transposase